MCPPLVCAYTSAAYRPAVLRLFSDGQSQVNEWLTSTPYPTEHQYMSISAQLVKKSIPYL